MPRLSDTMEEGTILRWLAREGEHVARGSELVEIETDKAAMTYESDQEGVLEILAQEGATLPVGELIARVGVAAADGVQRPARDGPAEGFAAAAPQADSVDRAAPDGAATGAVRTSGPPPGEERVKASPLARRMAREGGIDLSTLAGSGPGGRIVKADVLGAGARGAAAGAGAGAGAGGIGAAAVAHGTGGQAPASQAPASQAASLEAVARAKGETTTVELSRTQQTIARRMAESKATIPDFALSADVDMERCVELRAELKTLAHAGPAGEAQPTPTYNDMVVKAAALALREFPRANGSYRDGVVALHSRVNVGVAVAANEALVVPTVFDADEKSLGEIAREARALIERVRAGTITPPELGGGTFTVSNLGMYGITSFTPIINPPQAAILSVGALQPRVVARDGGMHVRETLTLTLVCDHRILYGAGAAQFLARIRELLQSPSALTL